MDAVIDHIILFCLQCMALKKNSYARILHSTGNAPEMLGLLSAAAVLLWEHQLILWSEKSFPSHLLALLTQNAIMTYAEPQSTCLPMHPLDGPRTIICTNPATAFTGLVIDTVAQSYHLCIEVGHIRNDNKNPVADHATQDLEH